MTTFIYDSVYARVTARGKVREFLAAPQTFALWSQHQRAVTAGMATWHARQWIEAFLHDMTGIPWRVSATEADMAVMPRHNPLLPMDIHEKTTDDPLVLLPAWVIRLTQDDVSGTAMLRFLEEMPKKAPDAAQALFWDLWEKKH